MQSGLLPQLSISGIRGKMDGRDEGQGREGKGSSMARQYGRIPRGGGKAAAKTEPAEIRLVIAQTYTWEQFALEVQRAFHQVQEYGATGLVRFRAQLMPLDEAGKPMTLYNEHGQPVTAIHIPELAEEKPYRDNEPGVGVATVEPRPQSPATPKAGNTPSR